MEERKKKEARRGMGMGDDEQDDGGARMEMQ